MNLAGKTSYHFLSLVISMRMDLQPLPGITNHRGEIRLSGNPAQFIPDPLTGSDEDGWVSSTPGSRNSIDGPSGYFTCRLDHLAYRESFAISKIVDPMFPSLDALYSEHVGAGQVLDVNIVADRRSIGCGIVSSVDLHLGTLPSRHRKHEGNKVCLRVMIFSQRPAGPCNIEIAQADRCQTIRSDHKANHLVDRQLRSSIRIRRARNGRLENWNLCRLPIHCGS